MSRALSIDGWTVMLVSNSTALRVTFATYLIGRAIKLYSALNLAEAREMLATLRPDVTILDGDADDERGLDLIPDIREARSRLLIISSKGDVQDRVRGLTLGADDYLVKPVDLEELFLRFRNIMVTRHPRTDGGGILDINGIKVDMLTRSVLNKDNTRGPELTESEFILLRVLGRSLNRVVSRESLFNASKSGPYLNESRTIDVSVSRLRLKLKSTDIGAQILSVRDMGYILRFEAEAEPRTESAPPIARNKVVDPKGTAKPRRSVVGQLGGSSPTEVA